MKDGLKLDGSGISPYISVYIEVTYDEKLAARHNNQLQKVGKIRKKLAFTAFKIIRFSMSPWAAPIVLVLKKTGDTRLCVDFRKLNAITKKDSFPLPRIDDVLDLLQGQKYFSTLDLASGYWQIELRSV